MFALLTHRLLVFAGFVLVALLLLPSHGYTEDFGFKATLDDPPAVVSSYDIRPQVFSAAYPPLSFEPITPQMARKPRVVESSFDNRYIVFNTEYHSGKSLIPVAVPVDQYLSYRMAKYERDSFGHLSQRVLPGQQGKQNQGGISLGVPLPRRLQSVFGEGGGNLRVSGYRRISFSGRSQWTDGVQSEVLGRSKFPSLNMDQVYRFDIDGTIGSKISVHVAEDSETDIPLANRIQLRYKGDDDDILRVIEAGNTNLNLPNTRFVGYSSRIQGLFGIKTEAQLGPLRLIGIASQEKGSSERASISSTGDSSATRIRDWDYAEGRIYDLFNTVVDDIGPDDRIINLRVYEAPYLRPTEELAAQSAKLKIFPQIVDTVLGDTGLVIIDTLKAFIESPKVVEIDRNLYTFFDETVGNKHYIVFNNTKKDYAIGVWIQVERVRGTVRDTLTFGDLNKPDTITLKMLRPTQGYTPTHPTWKYMWRNVYRIPQGATIADLNIKIWKAAQGSEGTSSALEEQRVGGGSEKFIRILGLDQFDRSGRRRSDNIVDDQIETFRPDWGLLVFPVREPFNSDTTYTDEVTGPAPELEEKVPTIYNNTSPTERIKNSLYYIEYSSRSRSSIIKLNRANIIEGSERVTVNGRLLTRGPDYSIQYDFGTLTLLAPEALDPNARVSIDFEYAPFLAIQKKSLFGLRGEWAFSEDFRVGSTMLYKTDKAQDRKPRVGQETARMMVMDFDGSLKLYPRFLTKAINALPFIATEATSAMTISGEIAQSRPNPNIDNVAYVDDFESALEQLNLPLSRGGWTMASQPGHIDKATERGKLLWHNPVGGVPVDSVYERESAQGQGTINSLRMIFRPKNEKIIRDTLGVPIDSFATNSFGGVMTYFSGIDPYRVQLFEVRVKGQRGKLHFDFGRINEDANGDGRANTEDGIVTPKKDSLEIKNEQLEIEEDNGLDNLADKDEPGYDPVTNPDPSGDNWYSQGTGKCPLPNGRCNDNDFNNPNSPLYYEYLNGTEGNLKDLAALAIPDEEELSRVGFNTQDAYFSYAIDLSDTTSDSSFYVPGTIRNGWQTFRVPVKDTVSLDTAYTSESSLKPDWGQVTHVRVWFEADSTQAAYDTVEVAAWYFVQSNWQDSLVSRRGSVDTAKFVVASVSTEDGTFVPPPGVEAYTDRTNNVTEAQKGLGLNFQNITPSDTCLAVKQLPSVDRYSGYGSLEMFVYGDTAHIAGNSDSVLFFFRLGRDGRAFYEYRTHLYPGWDPRNHVKIDFNQITALKDELIKSLPKNTQSDKIDSTVGNYRIKGNPNINEIQYFAAGVVNLDPLRPATGEIWLDELRVTNVRRDVGTAARMEVMGNFADLGSYNFQWGQRNPYFRGISATTRGGSADNLGSGSEDNDYSWSVSLSLDKFLPRSLGASLPTNYSYSRSTRLPLLRTGTDIVLPEETRMLERSLATSRSFRISERIDRKGSNPLFSWLLNRQQVSFSYSRNNSADVNRPYNFGENYNVQGQFDMSVQQAPGVKFMGWTKSLPILKRLRNTRLGLYPNNWRWSGTFNRTISVSDDINLKRTSSLQRDFDARMDLDHKVFDNLGVKITAATRNDMTDPDLVNIGFKNFRLGQQMSFNQTFNATYDPKLFSFIGTGFSYQATYSDGYERTTKSRKSDLNRNWTFSGTFRHIELFSPGRKGGQSTTASSGEGMAINRPRTRPPGDKKATGEKKSGGKPFYDPPFAVLRFLTGWIEPFQYRYGQSFTNSLPGMLERPGLSYRFGFRDFASVSSVRELRNPSSNEGRSLELSSGFKLLGGIATTVSFKRADLRDRIRVGNLTKRVTTTFPNLEVTINKFQKLPLLKKPVNKFIDVFAPRTGFDREVAEEYNLSGGFLTSRSVSKDFNPLIGVNFKVFRSLSLSSSYVVNEQQTQRYSPSNGALMTDTRGNQRSVTVTSRYSFRAPGGFNIPLFGKVKVTSTMSLEMNVRKTITTSETSQAGGPFIKADNKSDLMISPVISYDFSQQIKGGLTAQWQDTKDGSRKSHTRMLQIWAEIRF